MDKDTIKNLISKIEENIVMYNDEMSGLKTGNIDADNLTIYYFNLGGEGFINVFTYNFKATIDMNKKNGNYSVFISPYNGKVKTINFTPSLSYEVVFNDGKTLGEYKDKNHEYDAITLHTDDTRCTLFKDRKYFGNIYTAMAKNLSNISNEEEFYVDFLRNAVSNQNIRLQDMIDIITKYRDSGNRIEVLETFYLKKQLLMVLDTKKDELINKRYETSQDIFMYINRYFDALLEIINGLEKESTKKVKK